MSAWLKFTFRREESMIVFWVISPAPNLFMPTQVLGWNLKKESCFPCSINMRRTDFHRSSQCLKTSWAPFLFSFSCRLKWLQCRKQQSDNTIILLAPTRAHSQTHDFHPSAVGKQRTPRSTAYPSGIKSKCIYQNSPGD